MNGIGKDNQLRKLTNQYYVAIKMNASYHYIVSLYI